MFSYHQFLFPFESGQFKLLKVFHPCHYPGPLILDWRYYRYRSWGWWRWNMLHQWYSRGWIILSHVIIPGHELIEYHIHLGR